MTILDSHNPGMELGIEAPFNGPSVFEARDYTVEAFELWDQRRPDESLDDYHDRVFTDERVELMTAEAEQRRLSHERLDRKMRIADILAKQKSTGVPGEFVLRTAAELREQVTFEDAAMSLQGNSRFFDLTL